LYMLSGAVRGADCGGVDEQAMCHVGGKRNAGCTMVSCFGGPGLIPEQST